jgi:hypothetical protein
MLINLILTGYQFFEAYLVSPCKILRKSKNARVCPQAEASLFPPDRLEHFLHIWHNYLVSFIFCESH